jgi:hypothetical protein
MKKNTNPKNTAPILHVNENVGLKEDNHTYGNEMDSKYKSAASKRPDLNFDANAGRYPAEHLPDLIRKRAYELFEARGSQPGHELDDWFQAEREIKHHFNL